MTSVYDLKPAFQRLLRPLARALVKAGIRPNAVTLAALAGSIVVGTATWVFPGRVILFILPIWLFLRMAFNAIDGMMAREWDLATPLGAVLNEMGDVCSDLFLYLPLCRVVPESGIVVVAFAVGAVLTEFAGLLGLSLGTSRRYDGPMGKSDRAFVVGLVALSGAVFPVLQQAWGEIFLGGLVLELATMVNRLFRSLKEKQDR